MTTRACEPFAERLAAYADGDRDPDVSRHVAACPACAAEVASIGRWLVQARRAPQRGPAPADEAFWGDFLREVRVAYDEAARPRRRAWRVLLVAAPALAVALVVLLLRAPARDGLTLPPPAAARPLELGPSLDVDDLSAEELDAVLATLEDEPSEVDEPDEEALDDAPALDPYDALEDLTDDQLERVETTFAKGA